MVTFFRGKEDSEWKNEEEKMRRKRRRGWGAGGGELEVNSESRNVLSHVGIKLSSSTYQRILFPGTG